MYKYEGNVQLHRGLTSLAIPIVVDVRPDSADLRRRARFHSQVRIMDSRVRFKLFCYFSVSDMSIYIGLARPDGVVLSTAMDVRKRQGLDWLARFFIEILSWKEAWEAGSDPTRSTTEINRQGHKFTVISTLLQRNRIRGSGTVV